MKNPPEVLTVEQADTMLRQPNRKAITGMRNRAMLEVMLRAGLRVSEVVNLRASQVRLGTNPRIEIRGSKGGKGRNVPIPHNTVEVLEAWKARRPDSEYFFSTCCERGGIASGKPVGARLSSQYMQSMVARYAKRGGIERRVTPHTFRHTYATNMLAAGFDIREVQTLLGHSHVSTTMVYLHVDHDAIAAKIAAMDGMAA